MLTVVILINLVIAFACLYVALRVWKLRHTLAKAADVLSSAERATHAVLSGAPESISKGQQGLDQLGQKYQQLEPQLRKAQQALFVLGIGRSLWQQQSRSRMGRSLLKPRSRTVKAPRRP